MYDEKLKLDELIFNLDRDIMFDNTPDISLLKNIVSTYKNVNSELEYQYDIIAQEELSVIQLEARNLDNVIDLLEKFRSESQTINKKENEIIIDLLIRLTDIHDVLKD